VGKERERRFLFFLPNSKGPVRIRIVREGRRMFDGIRGEKGRGRHSSFILGKDGFASCRGEKRTYPGEKRGKGMLSSILKGAFLEPGFRGRTRKMKKKVGASYHSYIGGVHVALYKEEFRANVGGEAVSYEWEFRPSHERGARIEVKGKQRPP